MFPELKNLFQNDKEWLTEAQQQWQRQALLRETAEKIIDYCNRKIGVEQTRPVAQILLAKIDCNERFFLFEKFLKGNEKVLFWQEFSKNLNTTPETAYKKIEGFGELFDKKPLYQQKLLSGENSFIILIEYLEKDTYNGHKKNLENKPCLEVVKLLVDNGALSRTLKIRRLSEWERIEANEFTLRECIKTINDKDTVKEYKFRYYIDRNSHDEYEIDDFYAKQLFQFNKHTDQYVFIEANDKRSECGLHDFFYRILPVKNVSNESTIKSRSKILDKINPNRMLYLSCILNKKEILEYFIDHKYFEINQETNYFDDTSIFKQKNYHSQNLVNFNFELTSRCVTPLFYAMMNKDPNIEMIKYLLDKNADRSIKMPIDNGKGMLVSGNLLEVLFHFNKARFTKIDSLKQVKSKTLEITALLLQSGVEPLFINATNEMTENQREMIRLCQPYLFKKSLKQAKTLLLCVEANKENGGIGLLKGQRNMRHVVLSFFFSQPAPNGAGELYQNRLTVASNAENIEKTNWQEEDDKFVRNYFKK